jgi:hypothetical protein
LLFLKASAYFNGTDNSTPTKLYQFLKTYIIILALSKKERRGKKLKFSGYPSECLGKLWRRNSEQL